MSTEYVVFSVRWPKWLDDKIKEYCRGEDRSKNWMIKKLVSDAMGLGHNIGSAPDSSDEVGDDGK